MAAENLQPVQGMSDIAMPEVRLWQRVETQARRLLTRYGFAEVRTPLVELTPVFVRSLGDTTDVVQKEMYTFEDRGGRSLTLRPEGTAGVIRHVAGLGPEGDAARLFYLGAMFRAERPQAGRRRQFHQLGVEAIGPANPLADVEVIALQHALLQEWGLAGARIEVNTRGVPEDRPAVVAGLQQALAPHTAALCEDCRRRLQTNILRVLDCKNETCRQIADGLPPMTSFMSEASRQYLHEVQRLLTRLEIPVRINPRIIRGLDYYLHTVWEIKHDALGAQDALAGGGRYQVEMGGRMIAGVGFAIGLERLVSALQKTAAAAEPPGLPLIWIVSLGAAALEENLLLLQTLRHRGLVCRMDLKAGSVKSQMRAANRVGATEVIIRGDQEMAKGVLLLKSMQDGRQDELSLPELLERLSLPRPVVLAPTP